MKILVVDNQTKFISQLEKALSNYEFDVINYKKINKNIIEKYDKIILSGGIAFNILHRNKKYRKEMDLVRITKKPILGICLGFQLICRTFGAHLGDIKKYEKGILKIKKISEDKLLKGIPRYFLVYENHRHIVKSVGNKLIPLAESKDGIEMIKHKTRAIWGTQFHPERFLKKNIGRKTLNNFLKT